MVRAIGIKDFRLNLREAGKSIIGITRAGKATRLAGLLSLTPESSLLPARAAVVAPETRVPEVRFHEGVLPEDRVFQPKDQPTQLAQSLTLTGLAGVQVRIGADITITLRSPFTHGGHNYYVGEHTGTQQVYYRVVPGQGLLRCYRREVPIPNTHPVQHRTEYYGFTTTPHPVYHQSTVHANVIRTNFQNLYGYFDGQVHGPYHRRTLEYNGRHIVQIGNELYQINGGSSGRRVHHPGHEFADHEGYVGVSHWTHLGTGSVHSNNTITFVQRIQ